LSRIALLQPVAPKQAAVIIAKINRTKENGDGREKRDVPLVMFDSDAMPDRKNKLGGQVDEQVSACFPVGRNTECF
jgi:hypothetical protein